MENANLKTPYDMKTNVSNLFNWLSKSAEDINIVKNSGNFNASIEVKRQIDEQIYNALQGTVVEEVLKKIRIFGSDIYWRGNMEVVLQSLKLSK